MLANVLRILPIAFAIGCGSPGSAGAPTTVPATTPTIGTAAVAEEFEPALRYVYSLTGGIAAAPAVPVVQARLKALGFAATSRVRAKGKHLIVELPDLNRETLDRLRPIIATRGYLELRAVQTGTVFMQEIAADVPTEPTARELGIQVAVDRWTSPDGTHREEPHLRAADRNLWISIAEAKQRGCFFGTVGSDKHVTCPVSGREALMDYLANSAPPADHEFAFERQPSEDGRQEWWRTHLVDKAPRLDSAAIAGAEPRGNTVTLTFTASGRAAFAALTTDQVGLTLAIIFDTVVTSAPIVQEPITGGALVLNVDPTWDPIDMAIVVRSGPLPASLIEEDLEKIEAAPR